MKTSKSTGVILAVAAATIFSTTVVYADGDMQPAPGQVECMGVNACKGQGLCDTPTNSCTGLNACKGQSWIYLTPSDCLKRGGTIK